MKKLIVLTLITALSLFFSLNVMAIESIEYDFTVYDNYAYDLETGEFYESYAYAVTNRFTVQNHNIHVNAETFHHLLTFDKNNVFLGYYNTIYATIETSKYLGTFASLSNTLPDNVSKIAFMIYTSSNDKPEPELNNHSLSEVFEENNLVSLTHIGTTVYGNNTIYYLSRDHVNSININLNSYYYQRSNISVKYPTPFIHADVFHMNNIGGSNRAQTVIRVETENINDYKISWKFQNIWSSSSSNSFRIYVSVDPISLNFDIDDYLTLNNATLLNLTSLGIDTLTVGDIDFWYNTYIDNFATEDYVQLLDTASFDLILPSFQRDELPPSELDTDAEGFFEKMLSDAGFNDEFGQTIIAVVILVGLAVVMAVNKLPSMVIISVVILAYIGLTFIGWLPAWVIIVFAIVLIVIAFLKLKGGNSNEDD